MNKDEKQGISESFEKYRFDDCSIGDEFEVVIEGITSEGKGVCRVNNYVIFVEGALPNEKCRVLITNVRKNYAEAEVLKRMSKSEVRSDAFCSIFPRCGGCALQHMNYSDQLILKKNTVSNALRKIAGINEDNCDIKICDTIGMDEPYRYRNKAQFFLKKSGNDFASGFYERGSHDVVGSDECPVTNLAIDSLRKCIEHFLSDEGITVCDSKDLQGLVRSIVVRVAQRTQETMAIVVINGDELVDSATEQRLVNYINEREPWCKSIYLNINKSKNGVGLGRTNRLLWGKHTISEYIGDLIFEISPHSFFQVNLEQTEKLYAKVLEFAQLDDTMTVYDIYCGIGTISLLLARKAKFVYGIESVEPAIADADKNAIANGISNALFICGRAESVLPTMLEKGKSADVIVLDPPRKGCDNRLLDAVLGMEPQRIVYVSCNPATLARDMKILIDKGYHANIVQPVDMFPWSDNVETVVSLSRQKSRHIY